MQLSDNHSIVVLLLGLLVHHCSKQNTPEATAAVPRMFSNRLILSKVFSFNAVTQSPSVPKGVFPKQSKHSASVPGPELLQSGVFKSVQQSQRFRSWIPDNRVGDNFQLGNYLFFDSSDCMSI